MNILGVDTGGTFTDLVLLQNGQLRVHKVLSTPLAPEQAILTGIAELKLNPSNVPLYIIHGSTVATNAVLENKGVVTVFITNHGLKDMLTIGRQSRKQLYNLQPMPGLPPVPRALCLETGGRLSADGKTIEPLSDADLQELRQQIIALDPAAVAINLLFSFLDDSFERKIEAIIPDDIYVSRSSFVLPELKEYERGIATWLNAAVGPIVSDYLQTLRTKLQQQYSGPASISVMQSNGGTIAVEQAAERAVNMLLSGPAGGLAGARYIAGLSGHTRLLSFDMGGTSSDVALIDGEVCLTTEGRVAGYPVAVPMIDMHTIGAGGGSIATVDAGGLLHVGPESAGATPGPACYGNGGVKVTVTDANLLLGRLRADNFLGGGMQLDVEAARASIKIIADQLSMTMQETAMGIIQVVNENMVAALKLMSVQKGVDPKQLCLVSFGGAGGLHVCALASALNMKQALVPIHAGVLSALGMLVAPKARYKSKSYLAPLLTMDEQALNLILDQLAQDAESELVKEAVAKRDLKRRDFVDVRYQGQSFSLSIKWQGREKTAELFHQEHQKRYGHRLHFPLQVVNARIELSADTNQLSISSFIETHTSSNQSPQYKNLYGYNSKVPVYQRQHLSIGQRVNGPALICDKVATTYVEKAWSFCLQISGSLLLTRS